MALATVELLALGRAGHRGGGRLALADRHRNGIEIAGADFALVTDGGEADVLRGEFALLHLGIGTHAALRIALGQLEHRQVEAVEAGEGDELVFVAQRADLVLIDTTGQYPKLVATIAEGRIVYLADADRLVRTV